MSLKLKSLSGIYSKRMLASLQLFLSLKNERSLLINEKKELRIFQPFYYLLEIAQGKLIAFAPFGNFS